MNLPMPPTSSSSFPNELIAYIDGGSRGNPGPAGFGVIFQDVKGHTLDSISGFLGEATNNVAEYRALLAALEYATAKNCQQLKVYCDSELVAKQMQGRYRVQSPDLQPLYQRAQQLARSLEHFAIVSIPREQNRLADRLANEAMDQGGATPAEQTYSFRAVFEKGKLKPLSPAPELEEGTEYQVQARKRTIRQRVGNTSL